MEQTLQEQRIHAAEVTGGWSPSVIKTLVLQIIKEHKLTGTLLDYGAGAGELLGLLHQEHLFQKLAGADILERPASLNEDIAWYRQDLNEPLKTPGELPNVITCSEVIEHLENPRATFRELHGLLAPKGYLILTMPNQESIRAYSGLLFGGHFTLFLGDTYPAHITALLRLDLERICQETGFDPPQFYYTNTGGIPKKPTITWQKISFGALKGRLYSDNIAMITQKK